MVLKEVCPPALIYLVFSLTQVGIDTVQGMYNTAFIKLWVALVFTILLNYLCMRGLGVISWLIVFLPFMLMTIIVSMLLLMFGLNTNVGKVKTYFPNKKKKHIRKRRKYTNSHENSSENIISKEEKKVLNDMVSKRTRLHNDPLQK